MSDRRLFFALWPDNRQRERLRDAAAPHAKNVEGSMVFRGSWHVTLAFLGDCPAENVPALLERTVEIPVAPFRLRFDRVEFWARPKIACLAPATVPPELLELVARLNAMLLDLGYLLEDRAYRPHLTLVRRARPFPTERLAQPLTFEWSGFELLESIRERGEIRYVPLKQEL
ncbi:MAG: RNA 2',3'-cyclic phosphodiesterase [Pseudomonadota bacterium]